MAYNVVPIYNSDNQIFTITVEVGGTNIGLTIDLRYNSEGDFWHMDVSDATTGAMLLAAVPLVTGEYPAADLLGQFQHLGIGSAVIMKLTDGIEADYPGLDDLESNFAFIWGSGDIE